MADQVRGLVPWLVFLLVGISTFQVTIGQGLAHTRCEFMNSSMASCTDKFLISAQLDGLPQTLRILVLDRNQINLLENSVFWRTPLLQEVSIAQNRLDSIYLDAFEGLPYLKRLNLSYNRLESFNEFILERNTNMEELDLSGNNFLYLEPGPLLGSGSLKQLYIRECKINSLNTMLRNLPNLETVDLSHNLLGSLEIPSFVSLLELKMVNLDANFLKCDKPTQYLMDWFRKQAVRYSGPDCPIQKPGAGDKFQRMEMDLDQIDQKDIRENELLRNSSLAKINASHVENELVMSLFNKTYFKRCLLMEHEFVCHLLENCKNSLNCDKYLEEQKKHNSLNFYFIMAIFVIGVFIGGILALCCGQACFYCRIDKKQRRMRRQRGYQAAGVDSYAGDREDHDDDIQMRPMTISRRGPGRGVNEDDRDDEDVDLARRPTRHCQANGRQLAVQSMPMEESSGFHEFVNELFSRRRSRRQMISAIGQQGTNLVRQLSRSSLNLLRRQQNRAANANARNAPYTPTGPAPESPSSPVYEALVYDPIDGETQRSRGGRGGGAVLGRSRSFTYSPETINSNNDDVMEEILRQQRRSESPPPTYDLCVTLPKERCILRD